MLKKYSHKTIVFSLLFVLLVPLSCAEDSEEQEIDERLWIDTAHKLMWQNSFDEEEGGYWVISRKESEGYCDELELAEYDDWRMPSLYELKTLIRNCPATEPEGECELSETCADWETCYSDACDGCEESVDCTYRPVELQGYCGRYYTDTQYVPNTLPSPHEMEAVFMVDFWTGEILRYQVPETDSFGSDYIRCVRDL